MSMLANFLSISQPRWAVVPTPEEAQLILPGLRARELDQVVERFDRQCAVGEQEKRERADRRHRLEVAQQVDRQVRAQRLHDRVGAGGEQHGVAVGRAPCATLRAATTPPAVGWMSISTCWPQAAVSFWPIQPRHGVRARPDHEEDRPASDSPARARRRRELPQPTMHESRSTASARRRRGAMQFLPWLAPCRSYAGWRRLPLSAFRMPRRARKTRRRTAGRSGCSRRGWCRAAPRYRRP